MPQLFSEPISRRSNDLLYGETTGEPKRIRIADASHAETIQGATHLVIERIPKEELLATDFQSLIRPEDLAVTTENVKRLLTGEASHRQVEKRYVHKLGHEIVSLTSLSVVRDAQARPLNFIAQVQDISANKRRKWNVRLSLK